MTLREVSQYFNQICTKHQQINGYGFGPINALNFMDLKYPYVHMTPIAVNYTDNTAIYTIDLFILDILLSGKTNELNILSDTSAILGDIVKEITEENITIYGMQVELNSADALFSITKDGVSGWVANMNIEIPTSLGNCDVPMDA